MIITVSVFILFVCFLVSHWTWSKGDADGVGMGWLRSLGFMGNVNTNIYSEMLLVTLKENMKKRQKVWTDCCCQDQISYIKTQN